MPVTMTPVGDVRDKLRNLPHNPSPDWLEARDGYPIYEAIGRALAPESISEIGAYVGYSLIALAAGSGRTTTMRWADDESYRAGSNRMCRENIRESMPTVSILGMQVCESIFDLAKYRADLFHIDGEHRRAGKVRDLEIAWASGSRYVLVDDYLTIDAVRAGFDFWANSRNVPFLVLHSARGQALVDRFSCGWRDGLIIPDRAVFGVDVSVGAPKGD